MYSSTAFPDSRSSVFSLVHPFQTRDLGVVLHAGVQGFALGPKRLASKQGRATPSPSALKDRDREMGHMLAVSMCEAGVKPHVPVPRALQGPRRGPGCCSAGRAALRPTRGSSGSQRVESECEKSRRGGPEASCAKEVQQLLRPQDWDAHVSASATQHPHKLLNLYLRPGDSLLTWEAGYIRIRTVWSASLASRTQDIQSPAS